MIVETTSTTERSIAGTVNREWRMMNFKKAADPLVPALVPPPRLSIRAAAVRDELELLERELEQTRAALQEQTNRAVVAEKRVNDLKAENTYLANNRDALLRDNAQLAVIFSTILKLAERAKEIQANPHEELMAQAPAHDPYAQIAEDIRAKAMNVALEEPKE